MEHEEEYWEKYKVPVKFEHEEYYKALADRICCNGMSEESLLQVAEYKPNKSFRDLQRIVNRHRIASALAGGVHLGCLVDCVTPKICDVVEIDASQPLFDYILKLCKLPSH